MIILENYRTDQKKQHNTSQNGQEVLHDSEPKQLDNIGEAGKAQSTEPNGTPNQTEDKHESDNTHQGSETTDNTEVQNGPENSDDETDEDTTTGLDTSKDVDQKTGRSQPPKKKRRKSQFSTLKSSLQIQLSEDEVKNLPKGNKVTREQVQKLLEKYDLPPFTPLPNMGPSKILSPQEEQTIRVYLNELDSFGIARTTDEFQEDVQFYFNSKPKDDKTKGHVFGNNTIYFSNKP